jgi:hypothetical protein
MFFNHALRTPCDLIHFFENSKKNINEKEKQKITNFILEIETIEIFKENLSKIRHDAYIWLWDSYFIVNEKKLLESMGATCLDVLPHTILNNCAEKITIFFHFYIKHNIKLRFYFLYSTIIIVGDFRLKTEDPIFDLHLQNTKILFNRMSIRRKIEQNLLLLSRVSPNSIFNILPLDIFKYIFSLI